MLLALTYTKQTWFCSWFWFFCTWAPVQILFQPLWIAGDRWAWVEKGLQPAAEASKGVCRSQEPANLTYLEVEEEEELLSFHACKIQCRKALATDTVSS